MRTIYITSVATALAAIASPCLAQTQPRQFQAAQIHASCLRQYSDPKFCNTVLDMVRSRYGETVTMMQWNAQVGVYGHKRRQGKI